MLAVNIAFVRETGGISQVFTASHLGFSKIPNAFTTVKDRMLSVDPSLDTSQGVGVFFDNPHVVETGKDTNTKLTHRKDALVDWICYSPRCCPWGEIKGVWIRGSRAPVIASCDDNIPLDFNFLTNHWA